MITTHITDLDNIRVRAGCHMIRRAGIHVVAAGARRHRSITQLHILQGFGSKDDLITDTVIKVDWLTVDITKNIQQHMAQVIYMLFLVSENVHVIGNLLTKRSHSKETFLTRHGGKIASINMEQYHCHPMQSMFVATLKCLA